MLSKILEKGILTKFIILIPPIITTYHILYIIFYIYFELPFEYTIILLKLSFELNIYFLVLFIDNFSTPLQQNVLQKY